MKRNQQDIEGMVLLANTSVSKTEDPGSNPGAFANFKAVLGDGSRRGRPHKSRVGGGSRRGEDTFSSLTQSPRWSRMGSARRATGA